MTDMAGVPSFLGIALPQNADALQGALERAFIESIALAVVEALPEGKLAAFEETLLRADEDELRAFLEENVPRAEDAIAELMRDMSENVRVFATAGI